MAHYQKTCVFCKIARRQVEHSQFWEDRSYIAFMDKDQSTLGHALVVPKDHVSYVFNLHQKRYLGLLLRAEKIAKALKKLTRCKRVALAIYGFEIPHTHVHLIPLDRIPGAPSRPNTKRRGLSAPEVRALVQRLGRSLR